MFVTCENRCFKFLSKDGVMIREEVESMRCSSEEADTKMFFHAASCPLPANIIRTVDTDVLCIALGVRKYLSPLCKIWMEIGHYSNNSLELINIQEVDENLGELVSDAIPAFHIFTGSDYTAAFNNKGKVRPLSILEKNVEFQRAFSSLGSSSEIEDSIQEAIAKFIFLLYGEPKKTNNINDARLNHFIRSYKIKNDNLDLIKGCDSSNMPLCLPALHQKIKRTNYIMSILKSAHMPYPLLQLHPEENGWHLYGDVYEFNWFDGDQNPCRYAGS